ncbi:MAG: hypothetical protein ABGZ24_27250, partial [Fuerstiella sp.]
MARATTRFEHQQHTRLIADQASEEKGITMQSIDKSKAIHRVMELMAIPGQSCEESKVATWLREELIRAGVPKSAISSDTAHRRSPAGGQVGNLIVKLKGNIRAPRRLLMAHLDTVPLAVGCKPVRKGDLVRPAGKTALG